MNPELNRIATVIKSKAYSFINEKELQEGISQALNMEGIAHEREMVLSRADRIDFLLDGGIGIEVKIGMSISALTRQLFRYANLESIRALVVVVPSNRLAILPTEINGKPILTVLLQRAFA